MIGDGVGQELSDLARRIFDLLESAYGNEARLSLEASGEPLDGLILTILSQNTNDVNRDRAYGNLRSLFPSWESVMEAPVEDLEGAIRVAGLGASKARRIKEVLYKVKETLGTLSLGAMRSWRRDEVEAFLSTLPGVGPKTVACVLVFDLGIPAFPVDTHVARLSVRMGLAPGGMKPWEIQLRLESLIDPERYLGAHVNLIFHGRRICKAQRPRCGDCPLLGTCLQVGL
ncbi:endonuclease III domain-containing protein [Thermanaerovibrio acidaminovorans]|uniref:endonuclease III domain-containing protein n=1 Tax=Thermanaerovibrio acidaminovorans TaxID=81462 RepID=UPI0024922BFE|nr:endonuclease III [Thermanaerovibrio acidaminovorans]